MVRFFVLKMWTRPTHNVQNYITICEVSSRSQLTVVVQLAAEMIRSENRTRFPVLQAALPVATLPVTTSKLRIYLGFNDIYFPHMNKVMFYVNNVAQTNACSHSHTINTYIMYSDAVNDLQDDKWLDGSSP